MLNFASVESMYSRPVSVVLPYSPRRDVVVEKKNIDKATETIMRAGSITRKELIATSGLNKTTIDRVAKILAEKKIIHCSTVSIGKCQHKLIKYRGN